MADYQLIVIGGGPGGYDAALRAADYGMKTALIEKRELGGTCVNRGCIPTKTILHSSEIYYDIVHGNEFGVKSSQTEIDLPTVFGRKKQVSKELRTGVAGLLDNKGVTVLQGIGTLLGQGKVQVSENGKNTIFTAEHIILAAGMVPFCPPIPGLDLEGIETSDTLLEGNNPNFNSLIIIGGGVIGLEMATFYHQLGKKIIVIEGMSRLLPNMDKEFGRSLEAILKRSGMTICTNSMVSKVERQENGYNVWFKTGEEEKFVSGERVLCALGRRPDTAELLGQGIELAMNKHQIKVNDRFETSIPNVYAIGDLSSKIQLAHVASVQGKVCVDLIAGKKPALDTKLIPICVYTVPEIATVGLDEETAKAAGNCYGNGESCSKRQWQEYNHRSTAFFC